MVFTGECAQNAGSIPSRAPAFLWPDLPSAWGSEGPGARVDITRLSDTDRKCSGDPVTRDSALERGQSLLG